MRPLAIEPVEHVPYAKRATTCFVFYPHMARVWLDVGDRAVIVADVELEFSAGGPANVERVLDEMARAVGDPVDANDAEAAPVVRACLPYWSKP